MVNAKGVFVKIIVSSIVNIQTLFKVSEIPMIVVFIFLHRYIL